MKNIFILSALSLVIVFSGCNKKDDEPIPVTPVTDSTGTLVLKFENHMMGEPLSLNTKYKLDNGDTVQLTTLKYYVSNFRLINKADTSKYHDIPGSYFLMNQAAPASFTRTIPLIPAGDYSILEFYIGIDSAANLSLAQPGDLDPNNDMAWSWNTGYIFVKLEGSVRTVDTTGYENFAFHGGLNANYSRILVGSGVPSTDNQNHRTAHGGTIHIKTGQSAEAHLVVNTERLLDGVTYSSSHNNAVQVVKNFPGTIELHHTN